MEKFLQIVVIFVAALSSSDALCNVLFPCPPGFQCLNFQCTQMTVQVCPPCAIIDPFGICRSTCSPIQACVNGMCVCPPGLCVAGPLCQPCVSAVNFVNAECNKNNHCSRNERCVDNKCICVECAARDRNGFCRSECSKGETCSKGRCTCDKRFCRVNNTCIPCECSDKKGCPSGEICLDYKCKCNECQSRNNKGQCEALCGRNEFCNNGQCACAVGHCKIDGVCRPCECENNRDCPNSETCVNFKCVCAPCEMRRSNGRCQALCRQNEVCLNGKCSCRKDYCKRNGICTRCDCRSDKVCGTNEVCRNSECHCRDCYRRNARGVCTNACGNNEECSAGSCRCRSDYCSINGDCRPCNRATSSTQRAPPQSDERTNASGCTKNAQCPYDEVCKNRRCVCQQCQRRNNRGRCESMCDKNERCIEGRCDCIPHFCRRRGKCMYCCKSTIIC